MFEVGGVNAAGITPQDNKTKHLTRKTMGEDAVNSIIDAARSGRTNQARRSASVNQDVLQNNNYKEFNSLMSKSKLANSFLKESYWLAKGFEKRIAKGKMTRQKV